MNKQFDLDSPSTKRDLDEAVAQIVDAVSKELAKKADKEDLKQFVTKEDIKQLATKEDLKRVENKLSNKVDDANRRLIDLENDTPTQREVDDLKKFVGFDKKYS